MSKMDALRALREAKYADNQTRAAASRATPAAKPAATKLAATKASAKPKPAPAAAPESAEALCGHRNMSGRTCTREQGHSAKSHRYS